MSIELKGKEYKIYIDKETGYKTLKLINQRLRNITEIKGLEKLVDIEKLILSFNDIEEIKGLEQLINLRELNFANNKIKDIRGLENLINLSYLNLFGNPVYKKAKKQFGGNSYGEFKEPPKIS